LKGLAELQAARDYLQAEGKRVRRVNANYAHLAQTASASARVIIDSIGKWRIPVQASGYKSPTAIGLGVSPMVEAKQELLKCNQLSRRWSNS
jgi:hypothetical protein